MKAEFAPRIPMFVAVAFSLMQVGLVMALATEPCPVPNGPSLGISAESFRTNTPLGKIEGVRVIKDSKRRSLYKRNTNGGWQRYKFRPRYDVILSVNGSAVYSPTNVRSTTQLEWNTLRIWDRKTGTTANCKIYLD